MNKELTLRLDIIGKLISSYCCGNAATYDALVNAELKRMEELVNNDKAGGAVVVPVAFIDAMVNRFLGWRLPDDFSPDCGIKFTPLNHVNSWPVGTNLFTADQTRQMVEYMLGGDLLSAIIGERLVDLEMVNYSDEGISRRFKNEYQRLRTFLISLCPSTEIPAMEEPAAPTAPASEVLAWVEGEIAKGIEHSASLPVRQMNATRYNTLCEVRARLTASVGG